MRSSFNVKLRDEFLKGEISYSARQLDEVFWLEEERVVSEDWVVRYNNRLLQLERPSRHWAPAKSRVLVRENQAGEIAIHYRDQRMGFRVWASAS